MPDVGGIPSERLRSFVERLERLDEEISSLNLDKRDVYAEAKGSGFDTKIIREVIKLRKMESNDRQERDTLLDLYMHALGMIPGGYDVEVRTRAAAHDASHTVPPHDPDTGEILDEPAPTPEPAAQPLSVAAETIAAPVNETAPRPLTPTGGDVSDSAAGADDIDASSQTVGGATAVTAAASENTEDRATHFDFDIPDHLTEHQRAGYIARMQGKNGIAPEGYPNRREWSQGFIAALDHMPTKAADADDDEPEAPMPPPPDFNAEVPEFLRG